MRRERLPRSFSGRPASSGIRRPSKLALPVFCALWILVALVVAGGPHPSGARVAAENQGATADPEEIGRLIEGLGSKYLEERLRAKEELERRGKAAEKALIGALAESDDYRVRLAAAEILGELKSEASVRALLDSVEDPEEEVQRAASRALVRLWKEAAPLLESRKASSAKLLEVYREMRRAEIQREVETRMNALITPEGGFGYYRDQFTEISALGPEALPILVEMFTGRDYSFRYVPATQDGSREFTMRYLAGEALGDLGKSGNVEKIRASLRAYLEESRDAEGLAEVAACSLYKLGDPEHFERRLEQSRETLKENPTHLEALKDLAGLLTRAGKYDQAEELYQRAMKQSPRNVRDAYLLYNLACLYSLQGRLNKGVESLKKSVSSGFKDYEWIRRDRDLDNLRNEPGYQKLMKDAPASRRAPAGEKF